MLHLGVEPEPLCLLETTAETVEFFERLNFEHGGDSRITPHLGVNYDTCHLAVEYEDPRESLENLQRNGIKVSKIHLSSALKMRPTSTTRQALSAFAEDVYLHQVVARAGDKFTRFRDLDVALRVADKVTVMHHGRIFKHGTPDEIENDKDVQAIYLGGKHG